MGDQARPASGGAGLLEARILELKAAVDGHSQDRPEDRHSATSVVQRVFKQEPAAIVNRNSESIRGDNERIGEGGDVPATKNIRRTKTPHIARGSEKVPIGGLRGSASYGT